MSYACVQMFMEKLNQLINRNDIPFFKYPEIIRERPQFQLLHDDLGSLVQTLFIHQHQDLQKLKDLKRRFTDASEGAQHIVDLFLSGVQIRNTTDDFPTSDNFSLSLNLDVVRRSFKSIEMEFMSLRIDSIKMDSSPTPEKTLNQYAPAQYSVTRNSLRSKKLMDEIFVGLDRDAELIRDKLVEDQKKLEVVSVVGMGGIGKTTLAIKIFNDGFVKHHFHVRVWVTVSQTYDKRGVLIQILESIRGQLDLEETSDSRLHEMVHKNLMGRRYLIVIDDIWHTETWDNLKLFFPHDNNGSRILLTSRLIEVAKHANSDGLIHHLGYLSKEKSWELLCLKVFHGNQSPEWSIKPGMRIVENCQGLPLAVVVIAGVLAKEAWSEKFWVEIANSTGSYIVGEQNGCLEILGLSYNHLPLHLRECFLYIGGFPEDYTFYVRWLIWLWVAEGFIQHAGNRSLEDIAEGYLMDLIDRNLVMVEGRKRSSNGAVISCKVHDLVRELCLRKAKEEQFILQNRTTNISSQVSNVTLPPYKPVRMFINDDMYYPDFAYPPSQSLRSILVFSYYTSLGNDIAKCYCSFMLLGVLDLQECCYVDEFPKGMELLIHLKYLLINTYVFPSSICHLWNLQTLIFIGCRGVVLPNNISDLVNLRHLWTYLPSTRESLKPTISLPSIEKPMNLQTISEVELGDGVDNFQKCFPYIKELTCTTYSDENCDFKSLTCLEKLKLTVKRKISTMHDNPKREPKNQITFPTTLKTLVLFDCQLPWTDITIIQSLPNLQVLKLRNGAFVGSCWNTYEQEFRQLKFLRLSALNIKQWEACSTSFPCLIRLEIFSCKNLEEIPLEIGDIPTLNLIQTYECRDSVGESIRRIEEEQHDLGNYDLKIHILKDYWERSRRNEEI